jgi:hypothetical protein
MAIVVLSDTPDMTREQYETVMAELGLSESLPDGCLAHIAGVGPHGSTSRDIHVWESAAQAKEFMDRTLRPAMERAGARPVWGPPTTCQAHKLIT